MDGDTELEVGPRDCALLLAVPLTAERFIEAHGDPERDFCRQFAVGSGVSPRAIWSLFFETSAGLVARAAASVERLGATVIREARLADWSRALASHRVVTLVAHWRFVPITADDLDDVAALRGHVAARANEVTRAVDDAIRGCGADPAAMASALDALCAPAARRYMASDRKGRGLERGISRSLLEQHLPGLRPARAIELADRMHSIAEIAAATPVAYPGVIDLSVCNSILLAEALKYARRPELIVSGEFRASLGFRMIRYQLLIEHLDVRRARYTEVLQQLGRNEDAQSQGRGGRVRQQPRHGRSANGYT